MRRLRQVPGAFGQAILSKGEEMPRGKSTYWNAETKAAATAKRLATIAVKREDEATHSVPSESKGTVKLKLTHGDMVKLEHFVGFAVKEFRRRLDAEREKEEKEDVLFEQYLVEQHDTAARLLSTLHRLRVGKEEVVR